MDKLTIKGLALPQRLSPLSYIFHLKVLAGEDLPAADRNGIPVPIYLVHSKLTSLIWQANRIHSAWCACTTNTRKKFLPNTGPLSSKKP